MSSIVEQCSQVLAALPPPDPTGSAGRVFSAALFPSCRHHRIGRDVTGNTAVLVALDPTHSEDRAAPLVLEHLNVLHAAHCRIRNETGELESGLFTVVTCTSDDRPLIRQFITLMSSLVLSLPDRPSSHAAAVAIRRTIQLFRALKRPGTRSIQGLWGELFVIRLADDAKALVNAWRTDPTEQFDFADREMRLEVKTTKYPRRVHNFALPQVNPPPGVVAVVASMRTQRVGNGLTLGRLWDEVRRRVEDDPRCLLHADRVVVTSLGRAWRRGMDRAFDQNLARESLAFFSASCIPMVSPDVPPLVTDVHFRSDLTAAEPLSIDQLRATGSLLAAVAPES